MLVGLVEAMTGVGLLVGPILGSVLYEMLAMKYTFLVYGSFLMFLSVIVKLNFQDVMQGENLYSDMNEFSEAQTVPVDITIASRQELDSVVMKEDRQV